MANVVRVSEAMIKLFNVNVRGYGRGTPIITKQQDIIECEKHTNTEGQLCVGGTAYCSHS